MMNKKLQSALLGFCFCFLAISSVSAEIRDDETGLYGIFGLEGYSYDYKETSQRGNFLMGHRGPMYGVYYAFGTQPVGSCFRVAFEGRNAFSRYIHYRSSDTGSASDSKYSVFEPRLLGHFVFTCNDCTSIEPYIGLGGRFLNNDSSRQVTTTGHLGWLRNSTYTYIPLGFRFNHRMQNEMQFVIHAEYDYFISGTQRSTWRDGTVDVTFNNSQSKGYGARGGIEFRIPSTSCNITYTLGGFLRYWNVDKSKIHYISRTFYGWEPKNRTIELGFRAGLIF